MYEFLNFRVSDFMTGDAVTVRSESTLADAHEIFEAHDFNGLPVVDDDGNLHGFVTKLDVLKAFCFTPESIVPHYEEIMRRPVSSVMTEEVFAVESDVPLTRVLEKMIRTRVKSFPVVSGSKLVGMIAREDLLRALHDARDTARAERKTAGDS